MMQKEKKVYDPTGHSNVYLRPSLDGLSMNLRKIEKELFDRFQLKPAKGFKGVIMDAGWNLIRPASYDLFAEKLSSTNNPENISIKAHFLGEDGQYTLGIVCHAVGVPGFSVTLEIHGPLHDPDRFNAIKTLVRDSLGLQAMPR